MQTNFVQIGVNTFSSCGKMYMGRGSASFERFQLYKTGNWDKWLQETHIEHSIKEVINSSGTELTIKNDVEKFFSHLATFLRQINWVVFWDSCNRLEITNNRGARIILISQERKKYFHLCIGLIVVGDIVSLSVETSINDLLDVIAFYTNLDCDELDLYETKFLPADQYWFKKLTHKK